MYLASIRQETPADHKAVYDLVAAAFGQDVEARLVDALRESEAFIPLLSLVATIDEAIVGHLLFTRLHVCDARGGRWPGLSLAPLSVAPARQRQGIGRALTRRGLDLARDLGHPFVVVLGHPSYYPVFGFTPAHRADIQAPFPVPPEAFMVVALRADGLRGVSGTVEYPPPFSTMG